MLNLNDQTLLENRAYIDGEWIETGETFEVINPSNGEKITDVTDLGDDHVRKAIDASYDAKTAWASKTGKERGAILRRWYELMVENADDLASILTSEPPLVCRRVKL